MTKSKLFTLLLLSTIFFSCKKEYTPKPQSYFRIDQKDETFYTYSTPHFSFDLPIKTSIESEEKGKETFLTIFFPTYRARLYCTYLPIKKSTLRGAIEDSHRMAFSHTIKANYISQKKIDIPTQKTGGILYQIEGNVATPIQFFVTDSLHNYFRASLYFDGKANADSLQPAIQYMHQNIDHLTSSFRWGK